ncbi:MAG: hypothetical protein ABF746_01565 [Acetobacter orientalis]
MSDIPARRKIGSTGLVAGLALACAGIQSAHAAPDHDKTGKKPTPIKGKKQPTLTRSDNTERERTRATAQRPQT